MDECGCYYNHKDEIIYCPMHKAAPDLVAALKDSCAWHHLDLINGWSHKTETGKVIKCRLSQRARVALAKVGE